MNALYKAYNPTTRRYEEIDGLSELPKGTPVQKLYWSATMQKHVAVYGASSFIADGNGGVIDNNNE